MITEIRALKSEAIASREGRWVIAEPDRGAEPQSFDCRAIALRALRSAGEGAQLIDGLTGEVLQASSHPSFRTD